MLSQGYNCQTANQICQAPPLEQHSNGLDLSGDAKAKVGGLAGKLADLGIEGAAKYQSGHSVQKDLITAILSGNDCRQHVFDTLVGILLNSTPGVPDTDKTGATKKNTQDLRLQQAIIGTWRYTLKPPPSSGFADFELLTTYVQGGEAIQRGSVIYQGQRFPVAISGKWSIRSGILHSRVESSNVEFVVKVGDTWEGRIISIKNDKLTQINLKDGQRNISFRVQ